MKKVFSRRNLTFGGIGSIATMALLGKSNKTEAAAPENSNVTFIKRYIFSYAFAPFDKSNM